ncbi:MAG: hypothetical protein AAGI24_14875 [Pseudomonadota bacterium]
METNPWENTIELLLAAAFVLVTAFDRFNQPNDIRYTTTGVHYWGTVTAYWVFCLGLYLFCCFYPKVVEWLPLSDSMVESLKGMSTPFVSAMIVSVVAPRIPLVNAYDQKVIKTLHNFARIPSEVRRLSQSIMQSAVSLENYSSEISELNRKYSDSLGGFSFGNGDQGVHYALFIKAACVYSRMDALSNRGEIAQYRATHAAEFNELREGFDLMLAKASRTMTLEESCRDGHEDLKSALGEIHKDFEELCNSFYECLCLSISRYLLKQKLTNSTRDKALAALGIEYKKKHSADSLNFAILLSGIAFVVVSFVVAIFQGTEDLLTPGALVIIGTPTANLLTPAFVTALLATIWPIHIEYPPRRYPPFHRYVASGFLAFCAAVLLASIFRLRHFHDISRVVDHALDNWSFVAAVIAVCLLWRIDTAVSSRIRKQHQKYVDAILVALPATSVMWIVASSESKAEPIFQETLLMLVVVTALLTAIIGFMLPDFFKESSNTGVVDP